MGVDKLLINTGWAVNKSTPSWGLKCQHFISVWRRYEVSAQGHIRQVTTEYGLVDRFNN